MYVNQVPVQVGSCASFSSSPSLRTPYLLRIIVSSFSSLFLPSIDVGITKIQTFIPSRHSYPYSFWHSQQKSEYLCSTIMMKWTHFTVSSASKLSPRSSRPCAAASTILSTRSHYSYASPGHFHGVGNNNNSDTTYHRHDWKQRGFTVGIGGPVGSGKTALVLALTKRLAEKVPLGVVTNDIFTQEDAQFLTRNEALPAELIRAVETGGCPHAAIREDVSANLTACEDLTRVLTMKSKNNESGDAAAAMILCESGGDNLAANFSRELADLTLYVIDVAGGDKVPRKGGPGITQSDLLIINKIDLAEAVGADLGVMRRDADRMRSSPTDPGMIGPTVFASVRHGTAVDDIENFILDRYAFATKDDASSSEEHA